MVYLVLPLNMCFSKKVEAKEKYYLMSYAVVAESQR